MKNDPYIKQSQDVNNPVNRLYNGGNLVPLSESSNFAINPQRLAEQQQRKVAVQYKAPFNFEKDKLKFEPDAYNPQKLYITFNYSSEKQIYGNIYFNSVFEPDNNQS